MKIGIPAESMAGENRMSLTPSGVTELVLGGHEVHVECGSGIGSGYPDEPSLGRITPFAWSFCNVRQQ